MKSVKRYLLVHKDALVQIAGKSVESTHERSFDCRSTKSLCECQEILDALMDNGHLEARELRDMKVVQVTITDVFAVKTPTEVTFEAETNNYM